MALSVKSAHFGLKVVSSTSMVFSGRFEKGPSRGLVIVGQPVYPESETEPKILLNIETESSL